MSAAGDWVPVIDIAGLNGDLEERRRVSRDIGAACRRSGFLVIVNHGVAPALRAQLAAVTREFFRLPHGEKQKVAMERATDPEHRSGGFRPVGVSALAQTLGARTPPDLVETFAMLAPGGGRNRWPAHPALFAHAWRACYGVLDALAMRLMRAFALALDLPETWFDDKFDRGTRYTTMVANYYPALAASPAPGQLRRGAHTDYGSLTVLLQGDAARGLQVQGPGGAWRDVPAVPEGLVVNIGDLMARWTNDQWVSTLHRVVNPSPQEAGRDRLSIAFFHQPDAEAVIECLPSCCDAARPPRYAAVTSGAWRDAKSRRQDPRPPPCPA